MTRLATTCLAAGWLCAAALASAQTDATEFGVLRFAPEPLGSRPAGLGGAFVALADGARAASVNPAGLAQVPAWELSLSSLRPWAGVVRGWPAVRLAGYATSSDAQALGPRTVEVRELGFAGAVAPRRRLRLGAGASWVQLRLRGDAPSSESTRLRWSAGALLDLSRRPGFSVPALRIGLAVQPGFDWEVGVPDGRFALRRPGVVSGGLAWRPSGRWNIVAQADWIRLSEVTATLERNIGAARAHAFTLPDAVEPRVGVEYATHLSCGCGNIRLRAGVRGQSAARLRYSGTDPRLLAAFPGSASRGVVSAGASLVGEYFGRAIRLDVDSTDLFEGPRLSFGLTLRL